MRATMATMRESHKRWAERLPHPNPCLVRCRSMSVPIFCTCTHCRADTTRCKSFCGECVLANRVKRPVHNLSSEHARKRSFGCGHSQHVRRDYKKRNDQHWETWMQACLCRSLQEVLCRVRGAICLWPFSLRYLAVPGRSWTRGKRRTVSLLLMAESKQRAHTGPGHARIPEYFPWSDFSSRLAAQKDDGPN